MQHPARPTCRRALLTQKFSSSPPNICCFVQQSDCKHHRALGPVRGTIRGFSFCDCIAATSKHDSSDRFAYVKQSLYTTVFAAKRGPGTTIFTTTKPFPSAGSEPGTVQCPATSVVPIGCTGEGTCFCSLGNQFISSARSRVAASPRQGRGPADFITSTITNPRDSSRLASIRHRSFKPAEQQPNRPLKTAWS